MSDYRWVMSNGEIIKAGEHAPCIVMGCANGKCYALDSDRCYPHTHGLDPSLMDQLQRIVQTVIESAALVPREALEESRD